MSWKQGPSWCARFGNRFVVVLILIFHDLPICHDGVLNLNYDTISLFDQVNRINQGACSITREKAVAVRRTLQGQERYEYVVGKKKNEENTDWWWSDEG
jgi:hypothetical protein